MLTEFGYRNLSPGLTPLTGCHFITNKSVLQLRNFRFFTKINAKRLKTKKNNEKALKAQKIQHNS
jgi:hypothetical protein